MSSIRILLTLVLIAGGFAGLQIFVRPELDAIEEKRNETAVAKEAVQKMQEVIQLYNDKNAIYNNVSNSDIERIRGFLPSQTDVGELLIDLDIFANTAGVILRDFSFQENAGNVSSDKISNIKTLSFDIRVLGTYENFKNYLDLLEKNLRLIDAVNISFSGAETIEEAIDFTIQARTYYQERTIL